MPTFNTDTILVFFVALTGVALLVQAVIALLLFVTVRKAAKSLTEQVEDLRSSVVPVCKSSRQVLERIAPRIDPLSDDIARIAANLRTATGEMAEIAHHVKTETLAVQASADEVLERVRIQTARVDGMVTDVLNAADKAGSFMQRAVAAPARQLSGILAALKAVVEVMRVPDPDLRANRANRSSRDKDMFV